MVIILTFFGAILFFLSVMFIHQRGLRIVLATITGLIFVGSTALMTLNYSHHFGMHKVTTTTTQRIYPVNAQMPLALYQPVGTSGKDDVYIYKTSPKQAKPQHTQANEYTHSQVKWKKAGNPRLVTTTTRWRYKSDFYRLLYAWSGMDNTLVKRTNTLEYPRTYVLLTTKQAKQLQAKAQSAAGQQAQATARQQGQAYVTGRVQAAMAKNPQMTADQIKAVTQQAEQEFQAKMVRAMLK
ncbi:DUF4811 domain-containing protein [Limosilactobacillus sp.]|uniref:DUF4811 domain-containing protein n=1 Tax=Limosilactobacillus sp. TaxID=2773925 RepID=UPI003F04FAD8